MHGLCSIIITSTVHNIQCTGKLGIKGTPVGNYTIYTVDSRYEIISLESRKTINIVMTFMHAWVKRYTSDNKDSGISCRSSFHRVFVWCMYNSEKMLKTK